MIIVKGENVLFDDFIKIFGVHNVKISRNVSAVENVNLYKPAKLPELCPKNDESDLTNQLEEPSNSTHISPQINDGCKSEQMSDNSFEQGSLILELVKSIQYFINNS